MRASTAASSGPILAVAIFTNEALELASPCGEMLDERGDLPAVAKEPQGELRERREQALLTAR